MNHHALEMFLSHMEGEIFSLLPGNSTLYDHCVKSIRIWSYSGQYFSYIFLHSDNARKMGTRITLNADNFYTVDLNKEE